MSDRGAERDLLVRLRKSERIFELLRESHEPELKLQQRLRQAFPEDVVRAALTLDELRKKARTKFSQADRMWFDRQGLEQATAERVARHKAQRFSGPVWDYCCGIGADAIALAERCHVTAVDASPVACLYAQWNAEVYGVAGRVQVVCADVEALGAPPGLLHIDPDRRSGGGRTLRVEQASPGLDFLKRMSRECRGGAIKLSPAANFGGKFPDAEIELISLEGEAKEATVWFGELATPGTWRATALPAGETLAGDPLEAFAESGPLGRYVYDPDPAVVRAGLVNLLAERTGLVRLDDAEEYLTSEVLVTSPFVRAFEVEADLANNERAIRRAFREMEIGQVEIKCRHVPVQADALRRRLPRIGPRAAVLIFARVHGKTRALVCRRV